MPEFESIKKPPVERLAAFSLPGGLMLTDLTGLCSPKPSPSRRVPVRHVHAVTYT